MEIIESTSKIKMPQDYEECLRLRGGGNKGSRSKRKNLAADRLEKLTSVVEIELDLLEELFIAAQTTKDSAKFETSIDVYAVGNAEMEDEDETIILLSKEREEPIAVEEVEEINVLNDRSESLDTFVPPDCVIECDHQDNVGSEETNPEEVPKKENI